jgi:hypothetical protein
MFMECLDEKINEAFTYVYSSQVTNNTDSLVHKAHTSKMTSLCTTSFSTLFDRMFH